MSFREWLDSSSTRASSRSSSAWPRECIEIVRTQDTGTLQYEIYFNADESECIVLERYRDSQALNEHAEHIGNLNEAIVAMGDVSGVLLGEPSAELRANMADGPVLLFTPWSE